MINKNDFSQNKENIIIIRRNFMCNSISYVESCDIMPTRIHAKRHLDTIKLLFDLDDDVEYDHIISDERKQIEIIKCNKCSSGIMSSNLFFNPEDDLMHHDRECPILIIKEIMNS